MPSFEPSPPSGRDHVIAVVDLEVAGADLTELVVRARADVERFLGQAPGSDTDTTLSVTVESRDEKGRPTAWRADVQVVLEVPVDAPASGLGRDFRVGGLPVPADPPRIAIVLPDGPAPNGVPASAASAAAQGSTVSDGRGPRHAARPRAASRPVTGAASGDGAPE